MFIKCILKDRIFYADFKYVHKIMGSMSSKVKESQSNCGQKLKKMPNSRNKLSVSPKYTVTESTVMNHKV